MGLGNFLVNYGKVKASGITQTIMEQLVAADLNGASEADLLTYEQNLDKLVRAVTDQKTVADKERAEAVEIVKLYEQKLAAIDILQADLSTATEQSDIDEITAIVEEEIVALESMQADVEREKQEADEAEADLRDLQEIATESARALKGARTALESAKKDLERQKRNVEKEEMRLKRQQELKGLTSNVGKLSTALDIMKKQTEEHKSEADAIKLKGQLLGAGDKEKSNRMQDAMKRASGEATPTSSIADRLAALKAKK